MGLSVQDFFDQSKQKVTARVRSYQLELTIRPIREAGAVLASLSEAVGDALQIRGISLTIENSEPLKSQARRLAIEDAKKRAEEYANEMGVRLGPLLSVHDGSAGQNSFVTTGRMPMSGHVAAAANMPIEIGSVSASCAVTVTYAIEG